jgi:asparagine synthase (glutamine-hydrolysing)
MPDPGQGFLRHQIGMGLLYDQLPRQLHAADRSAMAFGVESRFPFLDHELVDWCLTLPDQALIHMGWQKYVLRRALDGRLPSEVSWRADKVGYAAPQDDWLRGPLRSWAESRILSPHLQDFPFYDAPALRRAFGEHQAGANRDGLLWRWLSIGEFTRLFSEGGWRRAQPSIGSRVQHA